jgi:hypothetical protein
VLGNFHLRLIENFLEVADAERSFRQQVQNPKPCRIAKALVDSNEIHFGLATGFRAAAINAALLLGETIGVLVAKPEFHVFANQFRALNRVLRHGAVVVFHFDFEIVVRQNLLPEIENFRKAASVQTVINVVSDVRLEQARIRRVVNGAATIDEPFSDMSDLRDVKVRRHVVAIRQDQTRV